MAGWISLPVLAQEEPAKSDSPAALFDQLDKDNDGKLTREEVGEERERFFNRLVRVGDKDEDGNLTKEEFLAANKPEERPAQPQPGNPGGRPQFGGNSMEEFFKRVDQNGDGKLSKAEIPEPLKERFQPAFDRQGKDELTLEDLRRFAPNQFPPDRDRMAEEFFKRFDANSDGKLTLDEAPEPSKPVLQSMLRRAGKGEGGSLTKEEFKQIGFAGGMPPGGIIGGFTGAAMLRTVDTDRDGKLSKDELSKAVEQFDKLDKNGDGSLDTRELSGFGGQPNPGGGFNPNGNPDVSLEAFANRTFERYDSDKDDKLTEKELSELPEQNKSRITEADADKDGTVTKEELLKAIRRYSGRPREGSDRPERPSRPKSDN
jgi:Ca2+-binding EF-hand superfamily protein